MALIIDNDENGNPIMAEPDPGTVVQVKTDLVSVKNDGAVTSVTVDRLPVQTTPEEDDDFRRDLDDRLDRVKNAQPFNPVVDAGSSASFQAVPGQTLAAPEVVRPSNQVPPGLPGSGEFNVGVDRSGWIGLGNALRFALRGNIPAMVGVVLLSPSPSQPDGLEMLSQGAAEEFFARLDALAPPEIMELPPNLAFAVKGRGFTEIVPASIPVPVEPVTIRRDVVMAALPPDPRSPMEQGKSVPLVVAAAEALGLSGLVDDDLDAVKAGGLVSVVPGEADNDVYHDLVSLGFRADGTMRVDRRTKKVPRSVAVQAYPSNDIKTSYRQTLSVFNATYGEGTEIMDFLGVLLANVYVDGHRALDLLDNEPLLVARALGTGSADLDVTGLMVGLAMETATDYWIGQFNQVGNMALLQTGFDIPPSVLRRLGALPGSGGLPDLATEIRTVLGKE